jgi:hypothetical protein
MAKTPTPRDGAPTANYGWTKPVVGASDNAWGDEINADLDAIDSVVHGIDSRVIPAASTAAPLMDGTVSPGGSAAFSRGDHVHPSDTSRYAASNPNNYQSAAQVSASLAPYALTTSLPPASTTLPLQDGTAAIGSSLAYARADHTHPLPATQLGDVNDISWFGDGSDGPLTVTSTVILSRDMYYTNLTITGAGVLNTYGYLVFVSGVLDLSAAGAGAIIGSNFVISGSGPNGNGYQGGAGTITQAAGFSLSSGGGGRGGQGQSAATGNGGAGQAPTAPPTNVPGWLGGAGGSGGAGGPGSSATGGAAGVANPGSLAVGRFRRLSTWPAPPPTANAPTLFGPGYPGAGGGGAGSNTNSGVSGGGGAGGYAGAMVCVYARTINRSGSTAAGAISAAGGPGGNGAAGTNGATQGSGGGGGGGGGGFAYLVYRFLTGSVATNAINASGGPGGNSAGTTLAGVGGSGGGGGAIVVCNVAANTITATQGAFTGAAASGVTGAAGVAVMANL